MLLSIVIPVYNESSMLQSCVKEVSLVLDSMDCDVEYILVDDGSTDSTWDIVARLIDASWLNGMLRGVRFSRNFGKEAAILAGLRLADGDAVVVMDADLQHPPALIPDMLSLWHSGDVDVVEAVKAERQSESVFRGLGARIYYQLFSLASGMSIRNATDFKLLDRRVVEHYGRLPEVGRYFRGLTSWFGFRSIAIDFIPPDRYQGKSAWNFRSLISLARGSIISFSSLPLRFVTWIGAIGLLFSMLMSIQTLWVKFSGLAEDGFPTVILLILGMGSMILLALGLIGEYVAEIYNEVKRRPSYIVSELIPGEDMAVRKDHAQ